MFLFYKILKICSNYKISNYASHLDDPRWIRRITGSMDLQPLANYPGMKHRPHASGEVDSSSKPTINVQQRHSKVSGSRWGGQRSPRHFRNLTSKKVSVAFMQRSFNQLLKYSFESERRICGEARQQLYCTVHCLTSLPSIPPHFRHFTLFT